MSAPLQKILGSTAAARLNYTRPRAPGAVNDALGAAERLVQGHAELLHFVWRNLPIHAQIQAEDQILGLGELAGEFKRAARDAMRGCAK